MRIAIFGATSQIAKDLVLLFSETMNHDLVLFARRPAVVRRWLVSVGLSPQFAVADFAGFRPNLHFDAIINFVGVGNPLQAAAMGSSIFDVTLDYDEMALGYLRQHPRCRYIFISSGAAYGLSFDEAADENTKSVIAINNLLPQEWYGVAKLHAECRHRALSHLPIVDIRVFNYFSRTQDISARFLITDILRAIQSGEVFVTSPINIVRDYIGPDDFCQLVSLILEAPAMNDVVDCYTKAPAQKMYLLQSMEKEFGLTFKLTDTAVGVNSTGIKVNYFSNCRKAEKFGYFPRRTAMETILGEAGSLLTSLRQRAV